MTFPALPPPDEAPLIEWALWYASQDLPVFPCYGKKPLGIAAPNGFHDATCDEARIRSWWAQWPWANIGIPVKDGEVVCDIDPRNGGDTLLYTLQRDHGQLPDTLTSHTGGDGLHLSFTSTVPVKNKAKIGDGIDVQGVGSYVIVPPSIHPETGKRYVWDAAYGPDSITPQPAPAWLEDLIRVKTETKATPAAARDPQAPILEGTRETTLFRLAGAMRHHGASPEAIRRALEAENTRCVPPLDAKDLDRMAGSAGRYTPAARLEVQPPAPEKEGETETAPSRSAPESGTPLSDYFNARALVERYGTDMHYCYPWKSWLVWTGTHWQRDEMGTMKQWAKDTMRSMLDTLKDMTDDKARDARYKHIKASLSTSRLEGMVHEAQDERPIMPQRFDQPLALLNCTNGTLDLRTGALQPHSRDDLLMKCLAIPYTPEASCPTWERFLWRIMGGSRGQDTPDESAAVRQARYEADERARRLIGFLKRAVGYSLTGNTSEHCFFLLHGNGRNGKGTFIETVQTMLGSYGATADMSTFLARKDDAVRNDLADLHGARFVSASESDTGKRLAESLVKRLTGGDRIKARFLFQEYFEFLPQMHVWLMFNNKPIIRGTDTAMWERIYLIPFQVFIPPPERNRHLVDTLRTELPGILAWAVEGCLEWQRYDSLKPPPEVIAATEAYRHEMDTLGQFLEECCRISPEARIKAGVFYKAYQQWCLDHGQQGDSMTEIGKRIERLNGVTKKKISVYWYQGIELYVEKDEDTRDTRDTRDTF